MQSCPEGIVWRDPPRYWEQIVYPAYVRSHAHVFTDNDVEHGALSGKVEGLVLLEASGEGMTMQGMLDTTCQAAEKAMLRISPPS